MKVVTIVMAAVFMFSLQTAEAHAYKRAGDKQQYNQRKRIQDGVQTGQLTHREATALRMQQVKIRSYKQMAKADGRVTHAERKMIRHAEMHSNRNIYNKKHNNNRRGHR